MRLLPLYIAICAIVIIPVFSYIVMNKPVLCGAGTVAQLRTPNTTLTVSLAQTQDQQRKGLGGCAKLGFKTGMYFPFSVRGPQTFWMKDMVMPIDIVWVNAGRVVGVTASIPFPSPGVQDAILPLYHSPQDVDAVLEISAGMAEKYGLIKGAQVVLVD